MIKTLPNVLKDEISEDENLCPLSTSEAKEVLDTFYASPSNDVLDYLFKQIATLEEEALLLKQ